MQVIVDCTEFMCQTPSSLLLQNKMFSNYKSHCTMKELVGIAPHGLITFVSSLYTGSISDKDISVRHPTASHRGQGSNARQGVPRRGPCTKEDLTSPISLKTEPNANRRNSSDTRDHVEGVIQRVKENKLFDTNIPLATAGSIHQLFTVACLLLSRNGPRRCEDTVFFSLEGNGAKSDFS